MMTQEIQEMLEGLLNDEQAAEVLHRLSVSPEKLTAFRQHMALQGAFDRDSRASEMTEEEDKAVWAALLGATGGVVTGGASAGASGWLAKAAAFIATGIAGFFIGTATDVDVPQNDVSPQKPPVEKSIASVAQSAPVVSRIDTVFKTVIKPQIIYLDRIVYPPGVTTPDIAAAEKVSKQSMKTDEVSTSIANGGTPENPASPSARHGLSVDARKTLAAFSSRDIGANIADKQQRDIQETATSVNSDDGYAVENPNEELNSSSKTSDGPSAKSPDTDSPDLRNNPSSLVSLVRNGWELAYNERIGRITPAPVGLEDIDPNFGGRALDLSYRMLEGRLGVGLRLMYGSFSRVTLEEEKWFALGEEETKFHPTLGTEKGFGTELFLNYRIPLIGDKLALGTEIAGGALVTQLKLGGDLSLLYLITNRIGAQAGVGYSLYWYNTREVREEALKRFESTGTTSDLNDVYRGTMFEGRYGLFYRF